MRNDMHHVVNQGGNSHKYHPFLDRAVRGHRDTGTNKFEPQDGISRRAGDFEPVAVGRVPMRQRSLWREGDNVTFSPLRRWLATQVGREWAQVFAEMSGKYLPSMNYSLREWLAREVSINCYRGADGQLYVNTRWAGVQLASWNNFYVDPDSGLLCRSDKRSWRTRERENREQQAAERAKVFRKGEGDIQYHKRDGVWYEVHVASYSQAVAKAEKAGGYWVITDTFLKRPVRFYNGGDALALYGDRDLYAVSHRSLGRREATRLGLS